jgi:MFS family permease
MRVSGAEGERTVRYYGWAVAASLAITELTSWGILFYSFSVMVIPMHTDLGWSAGTITSAFAVAFLVSGVSAIFIGRWVDRYGARGIMTMGSCLGVILLVLWSRVTTPVAFYLIWGGLGIVSAMVFYEPAFAATAAWFTERRRQALTVVAIGGALASVVFVPVANALLLQGGWRSAVLELAIVLGVVTIPLHFAVVRRPAHAASSAVAGARPLPLGQLVTLRGFVRITAAFAFSAFTWVAMTTYLIPYLISRHYSGTFAAAMVGTMGASQVVGRLLLLVAHRWLGDRWTVPAFFVLQAAGLGILFIATAPWLVALFALFFGAGFGGSYPARSAMVADRFGTKAFGQINGVIAFLLTVTAAVGLVGVGAVTAHTAAYSGALILVAVGSLIAVGAIFSLEVFSPLLPISIMAAVE